MTLHSNSQTLNLANNNQSSLTGVNNVLAGSTSCITLVVGNFNPLIVRMDRLYGSRVILYMPE